MHRFSCKNINNTLFVVKKNKTRVGYTDKDLPETELMVLDRVILKKLSTVEAYGRRNKNATQNVTSSSSGSSGGLCSCTEGICKCCTGLILDLFNQQACMKVTYHPGDFAFDVAMSMNNRILYENSMSGKFSFWVAYLIDVPKFILHQVSWLF